MRNRGMLTDSASTPTSTRITLVIVAFPGFG